MSSKIADIIKRMDIENKVENTLFSSKYLLLPFYFGLMIALIIFTYVDIRAVYHMMMMCNSITGENAMMVILELIDLTMIANLIKMIIIGSYTSFFKKHPEDNERQDPNLKTSSGVLKVKIGTSLIGVASINLLQDFISPEKINKEFIIYKLIIFVLFIIGGAALAYIDYMHIKSENLHHEDLCKHNLKNGR